MMRLTRSGAAALLFCTATLFASCTARESADDTTAQSGARGDSIGDLSGAPRADDTSSPREPTAATEPRDTASRATKPRSPAPRMTPPRDPPTNPSPDAPPIHRTNPRDEDIMSPRAPGAGTGEPAIDLMAEVQALAKTGGCASAGECQSLPVGRKACGGPRSYVVFCPKTTDVAALRAKIAELDRLDLAAAKAGGMSDCMMVTPPTIIVSGGRCRASGTVEGGASP